MQVISYKNSSEMDEKYIPSLFARQIECWGSEPFGEYKICTNTNCKAVFSLEQVCGSVNSLRSGNMGNDFCCSECASQTDFIYSNPEFLELIKEYITGKVSSVLLLNDNLVEGFGVIKKTTLGGLLDFEFATRPNSYDRKGVLEQISLSFFGKKDASSEDVICLHQIFISELFRGGDTGFNILKKLVLLNEDYSGVPILLETRFDSKFYPISRSIGFQDISIDKYGYVIQGMSDYKSFLDFFICNKSFYSELNFPRVLNFRDLARTILQQSSFFSGQKFYN